MDDDTDARDANDASSNVRANEETSSTSSRPRIQRASSPDFTSPSPEMPPWLSKCLRLLRMHNDESAEELRKMMHEALARREASENAAQATGSAATTAKPGVLPQKTSGPKASAASVNKKPELNKPKTHTVPLKGEDQPVKKFKSEPSPSHLGVSRSPEYLPGTFSGLSSMEGEVLSSGTSLMPSEVTGEEAGAVLLSIIGADDGCTVCYDDSQTPGNALLKCNECQKLVHQLCQTPPVTDPNAGDPRFVWYCTQCVSKMKKSSGRVDLPPPPKPISVPVPKVKTEKPQLPPPAAGQLFKRVESKTAPVAAPVGLSSAGGGLAQMAASFGKTAKTRDPKIDAKRVKVIDPPPTQPRKL